jgi:hypothetical protein
MAWKIVFVLALAAALMAQSGETYKARLSAVAADARTRPQLAGLGSASAVLSGSKLTITGSFDGLLSPATMAQLRAGAAAGVRGPVVHELTISKAVSGMISGSADLTPQQIEGLHKGGFYVQIFSEKAPDGVLWGWFLR